MSIVTLVVYRPTDPEYILNTVNLVFLTKFVKPEISLRASTLNLVLFFDPH